MKFLTDENVAVSVVRALRKAGCNIKDIKETNLHGTSDKEIMKIANEEDRIIITHDKDFGNLLSFNKNNHKGVILLRFKNQNPENVIKILLNILNSELKNKLPAKLTVVSETQITLHEK